MSKSRSVAAAHRRRTPRIRRATRTARRAAEETVTNPWVVRAARLGYIVRGLLYGAMGALALALAFGVAAKTTDQRGALMLLDLSPVTRLFLLVVVVSLLAYGGWGFIRAIFDPLHRGDDPPGIAARIGFAWSGLNYTVLAIFAGGLLLGSAKPSSSDAVQPLVGWALALPAGGVIVTIAGVIGIISGLVQFVDAYRAGFRKDLKRNTMTKAERVTVDNLGRFGMVARGVIFTIVGIFIFTAGIRHDASDAHSFGPAFNAVAREPMGHVLLAIVALGFIALCLHSFANARWVRIPTARTS